MDEKKHSPAAPAWPRWIIPVVLLGLTLVMFADVLFGGNGRVLGNSETDAFGQFYAWREFGFRELKQGNLALWNPHVYAGSPYFGGFQAALLYPPNWLHLVLPTGMAINWGVVLHVFLMGLFTSWWAGRRGVHPAAALLAGVMAMFGGTYFSHIYAGHLSNLCTMVWAPLIFGAIDGVITHGPAGDGRRLAGWTLFGATAVALQILAGHPQYVFYTGIAAGLYALLAWVSTAGSRMRVLLALGGIYGGGAALAAVQLLAGVAASAETIRSAPLAYEFAAMFSLPPENLLTLVTPNFLGDMSNYWGRCFRWEMTFFVSVSGLLLAIYGVCRGAKPGRWIFVVVIGVMLVLALGSHTPLFRVLYEHVPGFGKFRGASKFMFPASILLTVLAAHGLDAVLRHERVGRGWVIGVILTAWMLAGAGIWMCNADMVQLRQAMRATGESYLSEKDAVDPAAIAAASTQAGRAFFWAAGNCVAVAVLLAARSRFRCSVYGLLGLAVVELFVFARGQVDTFDESKVVPERQRNFYRDHPGDYRVLNLETPNNGLVTGAQDLWGDDPGVVRRYAEFIAFTQGIDPDKATQYATFLQVDPLLRMLRLRFMFKAHEGRLRVAELPIKPLPHLVLISNHRVIPGRNEIFNALHEPGFDPEREVILEKAPLVSPQAAVDSGTVKLLASTTDDLTIEADLAHPAILLVTDLYTPSWRAVSLEGSVQASYDLQPANYVLQAVPLTAGHHHLRIEYVPRGYRLGVGISWASLIVFVGLGFWLLKTRGAESRASASA